ncbi:unnamed protein product [Ectocarpus sp. CCAP 1310/34]|nr:unnamed protein product [Ectocarpus sp. CCAP 1310/34]
MKSPAPAVSPSTTAVATAAEGAVGPKVFNEKVFRAKGFSSIKVAEGARVVAATNSKSRLAIPPSYPAPTSCSSAPSSREGVFFPATAASRRICERTPIPSPSNRSDLASIPSPPKLGALSSSTETGRKATGGGENKHVVFRVRRSRSNASDRVKPKGTPAQRSNRHRGTPSAPSASCPTPAKQTKVISDNMIAPQQTKGFDSDTVTRGVSDSSNRRRTETAPAKVRPPSPNVFPPPVNAPPPPKYAPPPYYPPPPDYAEVRPPSPVVSPPPHYDGSLSIGVAKSMFDGAGLPKEALSPHSTGFKSVSVEENKWPPAPPLPSSRKIATRSEVPDQRKNLHVDATGFRRHDVQWREGPGEAVLAGAGGLATLGKGKSSSSSNNSSSRRSKLNRTRQGRRRGEAGGISEPRGG